MSVGVFIWLVKSSKTEIKIVLATLAVLIILPIFTVVVFASSGVSLIGNALASLNPVTKVVELFNPSGEKVAEVEVTTNWPARGYVSDEFGTFSNLREGLGLGPHTGIDIANNFGLSGDLITTFMEGTIAYSDDVDDSSCGKHVKIDHAYNITSYYCHLTSSALLPAGLAVVPGDVIGYMGSTGTSTGNHLHLTIRVYGIAVDPRTFLSGEPERSQLDVPSF
jgi:murein DD-endopeptidase MepM/ murein hydrolase activator NlpD